MTTGMNFWDSQVWGFVITMTLLLGTMIVANILRNMIKILRRLMIPSSVLGGFLLLFADFMLDKLAGVKLLNAATLEMLTYHGLGLGFVAMALRKIDKKQDRVSKTGGFDTGVTVVSGYLIQGILGLAISITLYYILGSFWASGLMLPMGYGQSSGQAYNWGHIYEMSYGFSNGTSFGLTVAAMGFVSASIGGVIYLNVLRKKGIFKGDIGEGITDDKLTAEAITGGDEIPLAESMDKFTIQLALVFISYIAAYCFMTGVEKIVETGVLGNFGNNTIRPLVWGFNFLIGTLFALLLKSVLRGLKKKGVIKREYTNDFMQDRIAGFMFDVMVVASIAAIRLSAFTHHEFIIPLALICVLGGVSTYLYLLILCKRVFPMYEHEAFLSLYGMLTGTASTGVILLREKDSRFETQACDNLVYHQPWAILFGFPMLLLMSYAPQSVEKSLITLAVLAVLFIIMNFIVFRKFIFHKKRR